MDDVLDVNDVGGADNQAVADAIIGLENQHRAGALIGQLHLRGEGSACTTQPTTVSRLFALNVGYGLACGVDGEHMTRIDSVALAAVDDNDLILTNGLRAINHRDDATVNIVARGAQHKVQ